MAHANIYIRKDNETKWDKLPDKSAWVNNMLSTTFVASPPNALIEMTSEFGGTIGPACKHGSDPNFCRYAKNGKPCK